MSIESASNHLILCHPLLLPSVFPCIRVFSNGLAVCIRRSKYWSFSFSISPSNEYSGLISLKIDWFDLCVMIINQVQTSTVPAKPGPVPLSYKLVSSPFTRWVRSGQTILQCPGFLYWGWPGHTWWAADCRNPADHLLMCWGGPLQAMRAEEMSPGFYEAQHQTHTWAGISEAAVPGTPAWHVGSRDAWLW